MFASFHEIIGSKIILSLLVVYYVNYTPNYNQRIRINYLSPSILLHMGCEDKLAQEELHIIILLCV